MSKVCQYLKLCPKPSHYAQLNAHIYLATIVLEIMPTSQGLY